MLPNANNITIKGQGQISLLYISKILMIRNWHASYKMLQREVYDESNDISIVIFRWIFFE
jgi:hypothetical protein